jgi:hypothetical protein
MRRSETAVAVALLALLAFGLARAAALAWVCDDSFISLRYAQNLIDGHGLVYNAGERVEGYSNLLWTLLLAVLLRLGVEATAAAELPGIAAYLGLALCLAWFGLRRARSQGRAWLPVASGLVLVSPDFHVWATGGLETMLFTALCVQGLLLTRLPGSGAGHALGAGALLALAVLTRPDGLLFAAAGAASWLVAMGPTREGARRAGLVLLPVLLTLAILVPWKLSYYGDLFPTAFYSKSASRPYLDQGIAYLLLYLVKNWMLLLALLLAPLLAGRAGEGRDSASRADERVFLGAALLYTAHVVFVGGDFMFARRLVPVAPLVFLALESRLAARPSPRQRLALATALLVGAALPLPLFHFWHRIQDIGDERSLYPAETVEMRRSQAEAVGRALAGTPARVAFEGGMCVFGYYSRLPYLVEITGLTQYSLAKQPISERGVIGHEKAADTAWLAQNEIHFIVSQVPAPQRRPPGVLKVDEIYFDGLARARVVVYSDRVMDPLRGRPDVDFVPIERVVELSRQRMARAGLAEAEQIYADLRRFYFERAGERGAAWDEQLRELLSDKRAP